MSNVVQFKTYEEIHKPNLLNLVQVEVKTRDELKAHNKAITSKNLLNEYKNYVFVEWAELDQISAMRNAFNWSVRLDEFTEEDELEFRGYLNKLEEFIRYPHSAVTQTGASWRTN